jgi:hypothetical protein
LVIWRCVRVFTWHRSISPVASQLGERPEFGVRRGKAALSSGCEAHPAKSLPPEAIGAVMEVTKWWKPSISVSRVQGVAARRQPGADRALASKMVIPALVILP